MADVTEGLNRAGAELWAVSPQAVEANEALRRRRNVPFPILADPAQETIRAWGLLNALDPQERAIPYPAIYLVGADRTILWAHVSLGTRDRPTPAQILAELEKHGDQA